MGWGNVLYRALVGHGTLCACSVQWKTTPIHIHIRGCGSRDEKMSSNSLKLAKDPDRAWLVEKLKQKVESVPVLSESSPKPPGHTRFVCISDTHSLTHKLPKALPEGDVLLHAGDFSNTGLPKEVDKFVAFLTEQPHPVKIVIAGNHDLTFDVENYPQLWRRFGHSEQFDCEPLKQKLRDAPGVIYLEDSGTQINGIRMGIAMAA